MRPTGAVSHPLSSEELGWRLLGRLGVRSRPEPPPRSAGVMFPGPRGCRTERQEQRLGLGGECGPGHSPQSQGAQSAPHTPRLHASPGPVTGAQDTDSRPRPAVAEAGRSRAPAGSASAGRLTDLEPQEAAGRPGMAAVSAGLAPGPGPRRAGSVEAAPPPCPAAAGSGCQRMM